MADASQFSNKELPSSFRHQNAEMDIPTLKSYIKDLKRNLSINKNLVQSLLKPSDALEDTTTSSRQAECLLNESLNLHDKVEEIIEERNSFQARCLLNEQIYNESLLRQQEITDDSQEQLLELQFQLDRKSKIAEDLQEINSILQQDSEIMKKSKNIYQIKPSPVLLSLNSTVENLREKVQEKARELYLIESKKYLLEQFIEETKEKNIRIRALMINRVNRKSCLERDEKDLSWGEIEVAIPHLDLSLIEEGGRVCMTAGVENEGQCELIKAKHEINEASSLLEVISMENSKLFLENQKFIKELESCQGRIKELKSECIENTIEVKQDYENSLCYMIKPSDLESISEIEVNHSNYYESSISDE